MAYSPRCFAYYCSGHGYGHATRVSAFARHLLNSSAEEGLTIVYIVSSAPEHVFADSISCGARYRFAEIDPVIVQPLAYRVDRRKSVEVLKKFLDKKAELLERERQWLLQVHANCVLSDAAFLGCVAAQAAGLPSILITNFSFDSVYSYLSTPLLDVNPSPVLDSPNFICNGHLTDAPPAAARPSSILDLIVDDPVPHFELAPLVEQIHAGYRCADLLVRLPGHIPMPSFFVSPPLPSSEWVDVVTRRLKADVMASLNAPISEAALLPGISTGKSTPRAVWQAPLLVRPPRLSVYTPEGRAQFLSNIGIPETMHDKKVLVVSFGGQVFKRPGGSSRGSSGASSRRASREDVREMIEGSSLLNGIDSKKADDIHTHTHTPSQPCHTPSPLSTSSSSEDKAENLPTHFKMHIRTPTLLPEPVDPPAYFPIPPPLARPLPPGRLATPNHIYIPGAPPASKPLPSPSLEPSTLIVPVAISTIPPTPPVLPALNGSTQEQGFAFEELEEEVPRLLPDESWIAVVCGVSKAQWASESGHGEDELPENFFVAPRDVYMPDLTAVGDVLLGKLGYGTVSECVDACTPFVFVSRPLFIEEHGLRRLLEHDGVGVELAREAYEAGDWSGAVMDADARGRDAKACKRRDMKAGVGAENREREGRELARAVVDWVGEWWGGQGKTYWT